LKFGVVAVLAVIAVAVHKVTVADQAHIQLKQYVVLH
jgi:hypothetical protein